MKTKLSPYTIASNCAVLTDIRDGINEIQDEMKRLVSEDKIVPDFITFLRHHIAHIENQLITPNNWVVLGGASEKHVLL